ncbi:MAG: hypothetical protein ACUVX8_08335 [Candidatus Zipacnadales bacterium]
MPSGLCSQTLFHLSAILIIICLAPRLQAAQWPPSPDFFPLLPWDPQHGWAEPWVQHVQGLDSIRDCGFTMAGFVRPEDLPDCERLGLQAIMFPDVPDVGQWSRQWHHLSEAEIDERIRVFVEQSGDSEAILGYYLQDEPSAAHFAGLAKAVAAVKRYAPSKLAYINLFPNYATVGAPDTSQLGTNTYRDYLERFVTEVQPQLISYDNYMTQVSGDMTESTGTKLYYENLLVVRHVALEHNLPFWNIVSSNQIRPATTVPSPANLLLQAYTTLAAGGRGISWYTYYSRSYAYAPIDADGRRTPTWDYLQLVNRQLQVVGPVMNRLSSTGVFFTAGAPPGDLPRLPGRIIQTSGVETPVMVGEFAAEDGADYAMVVNLSLRESACLRIDTLKTYTTREALSPASGEWLPLDEQNSLRINTAFKKNHAPGGESYRNGLWLTAGQGMLLRFVP